MPEKNKPYQRTKPAQKRREDLMNAAQNLFLRKGLSATSVEEITAAAKVAKGTFYLYFSSKKDIHFALMKRFHLQVVSLLEESVAQLKNETWKEKIAVWVKMTITTIIENKKLVNMLFHDQPSMPAREPNIIVNHLEKLLDAGRSAHAWEIDSPLILANFLFGGILSVIDDVLIKEKAFNQTQLIIQMQCLAFRILGLNSEATR